MEISEEDITRFFEKIDIDSSEEGCWLWNGSFNGSGYGHFYYKNGNKHGESAHRISWVLAGNIIPDGLIICHKCTTKTCVNPDHLETGTFSKNNGADKIRDGTASRGEKHGKSKLTNEIVHYIRSWTGRKDILAQKIGVSRSLITMVTQKQIWKHI
jgi:hypothetical protein